MSRDEGSGSKPVIVEDAEGRAWRLLVHEGMVNAVPHGWEREQKGHPKPGAFSGGKTATTVDKNARR